MKKNAMRGAKKSGETVARSASAPAGELTIWGRAWEFLKNKVLHTDDSPERVARGVAVAWWVTFALAPLLGIHIWAALLLAFVFRANKVSMLAFMWVHNPVTMWPIIYLNARVGGLVVSLWSAQTGAGMEGLAEFLRQWQQEGIMASIWQGDFWHRLLHVMLSVGVEVWLGGALLGALAAGTTYLGTKYFVIWYRRTKAYRKAKKQVKKGQA
jgi:uncharacterized protein (DUF2062 family)